MQNTPSWPDDVAASIDYSLLARASVTRADIQLCCESAIKLKLHGVVVPGSQVMLATALLEESEIKIITPVGYPFGLNDTDVKRYETEVAVDNGAHHVELYANLGWLKQSEDDKLLREFRDVVEAADDRPVGLAIASNSIPILEKERLCQMVQDATIKYIVIGNAMDPAEPISPGEVKDWRAIFPAKIGLKVNARLKNVELAQQLIDSGATWIGISDTIPS
jgi:deoxyribose-phosphate aldolase